MELIRAQPLNEVASRLPLGSAWRRKRAILTEMARVLAVLHRAGFVHRDIKPSNVLLRAGWENAPQGNVVLVDMGIAKVIESTGAITVHGAVMGTAAFVAPELFLNPAGSSQAMPAADVFSWGVVAWMLLFGQHPTGLAMAAPSHHYPLVYERGNQTWLSPPAAEALSRGMSDVALVTAAVRALREDPAQRFRDGSDLLGSLAQWGPPTNLSMSLGAVPHTRLELGPSAASTSPRQAAAQMGGYTRVGLPLGSAPWAAPGVYPAGQVHAATPPRVAQQAPHGVPWGCLIPSLGVLLLSIVVAVVYLPGFGRPPAHTTANTATLPAVEPQPTSTPTQEPTQPSCTTSAPSGCSSFYPYLYCGNDQMWCHACPQGSSKDQSGNCSY